MKILFGVFDWGLGHATRDMVLIEELLSKKHSVDIISTGRALKILKERFGKRCRYHNVPSIYQMYMKEKVSRLTFTTNVSSLLMTLNQARKASEKIISKGNYDKVISDCRMDVYDTKENSYLINHQVRFKMYFPVEALVERVSSSIMKNYKYILVPDFEKRDLTGKLSHELLYTEKKRIKYIGILSSIKKLNTKHDIDYFISISGPEISRKELEKKILNQVKNLKGSIVIAGGNPDDSSIKKLKNVKFYSYLDLKQQANIMNRSRFIIARGGYTTIMELVELGKKNVLLIPSPGQTEQEYIAKYYEKNRYFHYVKQNKLDLKKDIAMSRHYKGYAPEWKTHESVQKFMKLIGC